MRVRSAEQSQWTILHKCVACMTVVLVSSFDQLINERSENCTFGEDVLLLSNVLQRCLLTEIS